MGYPHVVLIDPVHVLLLCVSFAFFQFLVLVHPSFLRKLIFLNLFLVTDDLAFMILILYPLATFAGTQQKRMMFSIVVGMAGDHVDHLSIMHFINTDVVLFLCSLQVVQCSWPNCDTS